MATEESDVKLHQRGDGEGWEVSARVYKLHVPRKKRWKHFLKPSHSTLAGRIHQVNIPIYRFHSMLEWKTTSTDALPPLGMHAHRPPVEVRETLGLVYEELSRHVEKEELFTKPRRDKRTAARFWDIRAKDVEGQLQVLKTHAPFTENLLRSCVRRLAKLYNVDEKEVDISHVAVAEYEKDTGCTLHIDNVKKGQGPVVTVGIGSNGVENEKHLDMYPVHPPLKNVCVGAKERVSKEPTGPVRITVNDGDMIVLEGPARWRWAHAVPWGHLTRRFTLVMCCSHDFNAVRVGYSVLLGSPVPCSTDGNAGFL